MLPKSKKEEDADPLIEDIISGKVAEKKSKVNEALDFDALKAEINEFLEHVDLELYITPNRTVPKSKRSKWRFEVKNFVKMLNTVPTEGVNGEESAKLLRQLYKRLAHGCGYCIFPSDDPFQSIGIRQPEFYEMLVKRTFATGFTDENIKNMLIEATTVFTDRNSLYSELETIYASSLATSDLKYKALGFIKEFVEKYEEELQNNKRNHFFDSYRVRFCIEELCETMLIISIMLYEPENAVEYYWQHVLEWDDEVKLYKILDTIHTFGDEQLWIQVYEDGLKKNIEPRDSLKKQYQELKNR